MKSINKQHHEFLDKVYNSQSVIYRICSIYTLNREEWNDLWQEILLQLWRSFPSFQEKSTFSTWMFRVALNTALMHQREKKRRWFSTNTLNENLLSDNNPSLQQDEEVRILYECIRQLSQLDRAIILLRLEQKSYKEMAEITGFNESNLSVRILRIKKKLRKLLIQKGVQGD